MLKNSMSLISTLRIKLQELRCCGIGSRINKETTGIEQTSKGDPYIQSPGRGQRWHCQWPLWEEDNLSNKWCWLNCSTQSHLQDRGTHSWVAGEVGCCWLSGASVSLGFPPRSKKAALSKIILSPRGYPTSNDWWMQRSKSWLFPRVVSEGSFQFKSSPWG